MVAAVLAIVCYGWLRPISLLENATDVRLLAEGIHSRYTTIDGQRIHFYVGGTTDNGVAPVVLVHGLGGYAEQWADLMIQLVHSHRRVYAIDLLGYGNSAKPKDASYSIAQEAELVQAFMAGMQLEHVDLGGWSMGGWVVMQVALDHACPQVTHSGPGLVMVPCVQRLMLFDSAGVKFSLDWNPVLFVPDTPAKLAALDKLLFPTAPPQLPGFLERAILRRAREQGWVVQRSMNSMLAGEDIEDDRLSQLKMPVLIVWGAQDHIIPPSAAEVIHRGIPQSVLELFQGCGHLAPSQCAGRVGPKLIDFLNGSAPASGSTTTY